MSVSEGSPIASDLWPHCDLVLVLDVAFCSTEFSRATSPQGNPSRQEQGSEIFDRGAIDILPIVIDD